MFVLKCLCLYHKKNLVAKVATEPEFLVAKGGNLSRIGDRISRNFEPCIALILLDFGETEIILNFTYVGVRPMIKKYME